MTTRPPQEDFIAAAAPLNNRDDLTPEQLALAVEKKELRIEGIVKNEDFGDQLRSVLKAKEEGVWTAEALALQDWSLLDTGNAFHQTASIGMLMFASFVAGDGELYDRAAIMQGWDDDYEPQAGSRIITHDDMPNASADFKTYRTSALDSANATREFSRSATEPAATTETPLVEPALDDPIHGR